MATIAIQTIPQSDADRAVYYCRAAARYQERGEYEEACAVLAPIWEGPGTHPRDLGLDAINAAVFLRAGSLTARLGNKRLVEGWQELAKDLLTTAADYAESAGLIEIWGEARKCLGVCYLRQGSLTEGRDVLEDALQRTIGTSIRIQIMVDLAMLEFTAGQTQRALTLYRSIATLIESESDAVQASFHNGLSLVWKKLERYDEGLIAAEACCYYLERCGNERYQIASKINLANLLIKLNRITDANSHLDQAEELAKRRRDKYHLAQTKDSRADAFIAQKDYAAAKRSSKEAVHILAQSDEYGLLIDCLVKYGHILGRLKQRTEAVLAYMQAHKIALQHAGTEQAAKVVLQMLSDLAGDMCLDSRLSLRDAVHEFEASIIKAALDASQQRIGEAALRLGLQQPMLSHMLETKHSQLGKLPKRKRSITRNDVVSSSTRTEKKTLS